MSDTKTPRVLISIAILALAGAMLLAGCGGSGGTTATDQGPPPGANEPEATEEAQTEEEPAEESEPAEAPEEEAAEEEPAEEAEEASAEEEAGGEEGGESALAAEGKTVFTTNCGSCHTLKEAGTSGEIGPNLDELKPSEATVEHQVINGGGPMPAFGNEGILKPNEIKAVATYVSTVAGSE
jgi:mono/diheme cytochrome c family protein